eukprot:7828292-Pyramimonas_sp.AAC.1
MQLRMLLVPARESGQGRRCCLSPDLLRPGQTGHKAHSQMTGWVCVLRFREPCFRENHANV